MNDLRCRICGGSVSIKVDCGPQPISNRFESANAEPGPRFPLCAGSCAQCGLVQLSNPPSPDVIRSPFDRLLYNEPESHLDSLVDALCQLDGISADSRILGLTYKEDTTLERFRNRGYKNLYRIRPDVDLGVTDPKAGIETLEGKFSDEKVMAGLSRPVSDLVIARHIFEHAQDTGRFLGGIRALCGPKSIVVFEVPDCSKIFAASDYSYLWEEHVLYFVEETFRQALEHSGFDILSFMRFPMPIEDSLIAIIRPESKERTMKLKKNADFFARPLDEMSRAYRAALGPYAGHALLFGAGHLAAKFLNLLHVGDLFQGVVDESPNKAGRLMPGSRVPIVASSALSDERCGLCLLAVSPENQVKVAEKHRRFIERGGKFFSAFQAGKNPLPLLG